MALVTEFFESELNRTSVHKEIEAEFTSFDVGDERYFQINTSGRADRKLPGKTSQSIQLNRKSARQLFDLLKREYNLA